VERDRKLLPRSETRPWRRFCHFCSTPYCRLKIELVMRQGKN
jgi:hypothetical protein